MPVAAGDLAAGAMDEPVTLAGQADCSGKKWKIVKNSEIIMEFLIQVAVQQRWINSAKVSLYAYGRNGID